MTCRWIADDPTRWEFLQVKEAFAAIPFSELSLDEKFVYLPEMESRKNLLETQKVVPWIQRQMQFFDVLVNLPEQGFTYFSILDEALELALSREKVKLGERAHLYFTAHPQDVRLLMKVAEKLGFKQVHWLTQSQGVEQDFVFGLQQKLNIVPADKVILLKNSGDLFLFQERLSPEDSFLKDLGFFNFLRPQGTLVNMSLFKTEPWFEQEAGELGLNVLTDALFKTYFSEVFRERVSSKID